MPRRHAPRLWPASPLIRLGGGERTPLELLQEILCAARRGAPNLDLLSDLVLACIANAHETPIADADHAEFVRRAHAAALAGQWERARRLLEHTKEDRSMPTPWPQYPVPPDPRPAWEILKEICYRAHLEDDPVLLDEGTRDQIFRLAFRCAANQHAVTPHVEANPPVPPAVQDLHILTALARAKARLWDLVRDELNHD